MSQKLCSTVGEFRAACDAVRAAGQRLGLVPTMGALHAGHLALVREAGRHADQVAVSIFVNPTQFGPNEDLERYPRDLTGDVKKCAGAGASLVFAPSPEEMYPEGERTRVNVLGVSEHLCGASRPTHFEGVATIVTKLFAVAGPCTAVFGRKDYQQLRVIQRMVRDLLLPVQVVGHPTIREPDGLALSSRNAYLSDDDRRRASIIPRSLSEAVQRFEAGERRAGALRVPVAEAIAEAGLKVDYVTVATPLDIHPIPDEAAVGDTAVLAVAVYCGGARLIDNVVLGEDPPPVGAAQ